jgi:iron complex transport system ATP-binding protein
MSDRLDLTISGIDVTIDAGAVQVTSDEPLTILSSAVVGGGLCSARHVINMHVPDDYDGERPDEDLRAYAAQRGVSEPFVGLMTATWTEYARVAVQSRGGLGVAAVVSIGLANPECAGLTSPVAARAGTINTILLVDAVLTPSAMVNAVITATEAKTMSLTEWAVHTPDGLPASGTTTDSVVVACTGRGATLGYAGPATAAGWLIARAVREAMASICREKIERDGGRRIGW